LYTTPVEEQGDPSTAFDMTVQWFGPKRIPSTASNPDGYRARERSPDFATLNLQVSQTFRQGFEVYLGAENLLGFRQDDPILSAQDPGSPYFDASLVWGPVSGRMVYAGLRYKL
jgi:outer membrane receptor protein involved in Fe transport